MQKSGTPCPERGGESGTPCPERETAAVGGPDRRTAYGRRSHRRRQAAEAAIVGFPSPDNLRASGAIPPPGAASSAPTLP